MESVASTLKSEREKRNISLSQIAADTRISLRHLESLEEGRYGDLPGGMYNRAFLRAYCDKLNLDQKEIVRRFEEELELAPHAERLPKQKVFVPQNTRSLKISPIAVWSLMLLISASGLFFSRKWITAVLSPYFTRTQTASVRLEPARPSDNVQANEPSLPTSSPATEISVTPGAATDGLPASNAASLASMDGPNHLTVLSSSSELASGVPLLQLEITATQECWISIEHDGNLAVRKLLVPGEVQSLNAAERFLIRVGNAGGVNLKINGKPAKPLGKAGQVIDLLINKNNLPELIDQTAG